MSLFEGTAPLGATPDPLWSAASGTEAMELFGYQAKVVSRLLREKNHVLVEQPTGSGKTVMVRAFVAAGLGRQFSHALIAAPQEQIEASFIARARSAIAWPSGLAAQPVIDIPAEFIEAARNGGSGSRAQIRRYLSMEKPCSVLACTHSALTKLERRDLPSNQKGQVLVIDEGHHGPARELGRAIDEWIARGGRVIFLTATPFRADGRPVILPDMLHLRRSVAEHQAAGFAPKNLQSEIVALGAPGDRITAAQFRGEDAPPAGYENLLVRSIVSKWISDGRPKTIVRVPPARGGTAGLIAKLKTAFVRARARVLDATGTRPIDRKRFIDTLEDERARTWATSKVDVVVGCQRVLEGSDWKHCSTAYCVGVPGSLSTTVQFTGRALRLKPADYPAVYRDLTRVVFFVPCAGGSTIDRLSLDHSRHALLTCVFMADHVIGQEWIVTRAVRNGIESGLGKIDENRAAEVAEDEASLPLAPEVRGEVELALAGARDELLQMGEPAPTIDAVVAKASADRPDLPAEAFARVGVEVLAAQPGEVGKAVGKALGREVSKRVKIDPQVRRALREAFDVVLQEFRDTTLTRSPVLEEVGRQVHSLTGRDALYFARRLRDAVSQPLTDQTILGYADSWKDTNGDWPTRDSGLIPGSSDTWVAIDLALHRGGRGIEGGRSLALLLEAKRGARNIRALPKLTVKQIVGWAKVHFKKTGEWPTRRSGPIDGAPAGETWATVAAALEQGLRKLEKTTSLNALLRRECGAESNRTIRLRLTTPKIVELLKNYNERNPGTWPTETTKDPELEKKQLSWRMIDRSLREGARSLPGGSSLTKLLREHLGVRNGSRPPQIKRSDVWAWALAYHARTGRWPTRKSGDVMGQPGEKWGNIHQAFRGGRRGLGSGSTLSRFLKLRLRRKGGAS